MLTALLIALLMLGLSFYYSGVEIAFLSASPLKIELKKKQGHWVAKKLSWLKNETPTVHPAILIGNTIALVIFTYQVEGIIGPWLDNWFSSWGGSWKEAITLQGLIRFLIPYRPRHPDYPHLCRIHPQSYFQANGRSDYFPFYLPAPRLLYCFLSLGMADQRSRSRNPPIPIGDTADR